MLTVAKVTQRQAAGYAEYLEGRSQPTALGDYYLKDGDRVEAPGKWVAGAAEFGLDPEQPVSRDELRALMAVRRPDDGHELRRAGGGGEAVAAIDATFSAPKSVSAVWALADSGLRERIEQAHEQAIERALNYSLETVAMIRERVDQATVLHARAEGMVATSWRHTTARAIESQPPDPQLHSHVLLHGAIRPDGKVVAIDSRSWLIHRRELGAAYRTEVAHELATLGFGIERGTGRGGRYFELQDVPRDLLERWSSRHQQIQEAIEYRLRERRERLEAVLAAGGPAAREASERLEGLARTNPLTPKEDRLIAVTTRAAKDHLSTRADLDRHWTKTANQLGFDRRDTEQLRSSTTHRAPASEGELRRRLTEFDATFTEREARAVALEASAGLPIHECLKQLGDLRASGGVLALAGGQLTTRDHRAAERHTIALASRLVAGEAAEISAELAAEQTSALERHLSTKGGSLSDEQRTAIQLACSQRQLVMIEGHAGSGKSTALQAIAKAHQDAGQHVIVTSTAALAAERLANELRTMGVEISAYSTVALHLAVRNESLLLGPSTTIIHEEAALASTQEQQRLLLAADASGARLILLGDPRQSQAVGAGGLWPYLEREAKARSAHVELTRNVRALDESDREAQRRFRDGEHRQALQSYAERHRLVLEDKQRQVEDGALEAAQDDREAGRRSLVIAQTSNEHLDELNARAQAIRAERGELGHGAVNVAGRPYTLHTGDEIQIRRTVPHAELGQLRNGTTAHVIAVDAERALITLRLAGGREVQLEHEQLGEAAIRLAYVQHPFIAQGQTTDTAHLIVAEHSTAEGSYVALTRARHQTHIHASREQLEIEKPGHELDALAEHMGRAEPEIPSIRYPLAHEALIRADQEDEQTTEPSRERETAMEPERGELEPPRDLQSARLERNHAPELPENEEPGDQPPGPVQLSAPQRAAGAIARYRTRYAIGGVDQTVPDEPGFFEARYAQQAAREAVLDAAAELDTNIEEERQLQERALDMLGLGRGSKASERSAGWEP